MASTLPDARTLSAGGLSPQAAASAATAIGMRARLARGLGFMRILQGGSSEERRFGLRRRALRRGAARGATLAVTRAQEVGRVDVRGLEDAAAVHGGAHRGGRAEEDDRRDEREVGQTGLDGRKTPAHGRLEDGGEVAHHAREQLQGVGVEASGAVGHLAHHDLGQVRVRLDLGVHGVEVRSILSAGGVGEAAIAVVRSTSAEKIARRISR